MTRIPSERWRRALRNAAWLGATTFTAVAVAAEPAARKFAQPAATSSTPAPVSSLAQVTFSLALVLAAVFAAAWLLKRVRGVGSGGQDGVLRVVAERAVGPRERVVLLQVGERQVLIGVANGSVRSLQAFAPAPPQEPAA